MFNRAFITYALNNNMNNHIVYFFIIVILIKSYILNQFISINIVTLKLINLFIMQSRQEVIKKYGHSRRPSFGKGMPISALLLNLSPNNSTNFASISRDGVSPEYELPPITFNVNEVNDESDDKPMKGNKNANSDDDDEQNACINANEEFIYLKGNNSKANLLPSKQTTDSVDKCDKMCVNNALEVAEALSRTSLMTSPAARRRLLARKIEMDINEDHANRDDYVPPKQLLIYLVR